MADHIKINTEELKSIGDTVGRLRDEFWNADKVLDAYSGFLGSGRMADTLHEFATNWTYHKQDIVKALDKMSSVAKDAAEAWDGLDQDLAKALTDAANK